MTLTIGTRLGVYEILASIGAGGMGEVYRARDTKLGREVAIKVLPEVFSQDKERLARFEREARLLASLNHPNIATIHDLEESEGTHFLVLELVPGETLGERIQRGSMPVNEALSIFRQIAEALEAAHEKGVIHRDLKPANVKITPEGKVKVLDFGLAKAFSDDARAVDLSWSPTLTREGTQAGVIMGTAAYMSPEQARSKEVDKRTDVWAFGCCWFEALTGRKAFTGETLADTFAAIIGKEPDWEALPGSTPVKVRELLHRCLQKDPRRRLRDMGDAWMEIEEAETGPPVEAAVPSARPRIIPLGMTALLASIAAGIAVWSLLPAAVRRSSEPTHLALNLPHDTPVLPQTIVISPDGSRLVYSVGEPGESQLFLRRLSQPDPEPIPGTEGAPSAFFSPDSEWVGFFADGMLKKVPLEGGAPVSLCEAPQPRGGSWGPDDVIFFTPHGWRGLWKIPASGGTAEMVTDPDTSNGEQHRHPEVLPNGKAVVFTVWTGSFHDSRIAVLSLETGERKDLIEGGSNAHYAPTGHLVYARAGTLLAVPFDDERLEVTGIPIPVVEELRYSGIGRAAFTFSLDGSLVYSPGGSRTLVWIDRKGTREPLTSFKWGRRQLIRLSPDGRRLVTTIGEDIWVHEIERGTLTRLTMDPGQDWTPIWSPDGQEVTFSSRRSGEYRLYSKAADGSGVAEELLAIEYFDFPTSWSPDGKVLAFAKNHPTQGYDIWIMPLEGGQEPWPFAETAFHELHATFSPDGKWLAFRSDESGRREVYVQPFPGPGGKLAISADGGDYPIWAPNGKELFYQEGNKLMAVDIETEPALTAGIPRPLFEVRNFETLSWAYDISPDGERFMVFEDREPELRIVLNWFEELERLVPTN